MHKIILIYKIFLIENVKLIDASPIGINVRPTVAATYLNVRDKSRKIYSQTRGSRKNNLKPGDF